MARIKRYNPTTGKWEYANPQYSVAPVQSVNGKTGNVTVEEAGAVAAHNSSDTAHADIRTLISALQSGKLSSEGIQVKKAQLTLEDGTTMLYDVLVASEGTIVEEYTNQIQYAIGTDNNIYNNGKGYKGSDEPTRLSSNGAEKPMSTNVRNGSICTGFIKVEPGAVVRMANVPWIRSNPNQATDGATNYFCGYREDFSFIGGAVANSTTRYGTWISNSPVFEYTIPDGAVTTDRMTITLPNESELYYIRMNCASGVSNQLVVPEECIITVNQEIPE